MGMVSGIISNYGDLAVAGFAGATAAAIADWRGTLAYLRHVGVGVPSAIYASEPIYRTLKPYLGVVLIETVKQERAAAFVTGAIAIFVFHYATEHAKSLIDKVRMSRKAVKENDK